jgi:hypothetical protein
MTETYNVKATVHMPLRKGYRVKATIESLGVYINGIVVFPPDEKSDKWEFRSPAQNFGSGWKSVIEFSTKKPLWKEIKEECFRAVREYINSNHHTNTLQQSNSSDTVLNDIDDKPINWNEVDIPF